MPFAPPAPDEIEQDAFTPPSPDDLDEVATVHETMKDQLARPARDPLELAQRSFIPGTVTPSAMSPGRGPLEAIGRGLGAAGQAAKDIAAAYAFEAVGEPGLQAQQLGVNPETVKRLGVEPGAPEDVSPIEAGERQLPLPGRLLSKASYGLVETTPKLAGVAGAEALGVPAPVAAGAIFGTTEQGFSPKDAMVAAALPFVGKYSGEIAGAIAKKFGVDTARALNMWKAAGGMAGAAGYLATIDESQIENLPPEQRDAARIDMLAGLIGQSALGPMGVRYEKELPRATQAARVAGVTPEMLGPQYGRSLPLPEGARPERMLTNKRVTRLPVGPPEVPETPAEPERGLTAAGEVKRDRLTTINQVLERFPALEGRREKAREILQTAYPDAKVTDEGVEVYFPTAQATPETRAEEGIGFEPGGRPPPAGGPGAPKLDVEDRIMQMRLSEAQGRFQRAQAEGDEHGARLAAADVMRIQKALAFSTFGKSKPPVMPKPAIPRVPGSLQRPEVPSGGEVNKHDAIRRNEARTAAEIQKTIADSFGQQISREQAKQLGREAWGEWPPPKPGKEPPPEEGGPVVPPTKPGGGPPTGGETDASQESETAEVYGDVRPQPEQGQGEVPEPEGSGGIQPQAEGGIPEAPQSEVLLRAREVAAHPLDKPFPGGFSKEAIQFGAGLDPKRPQDLAELRKLEAQAAAELRAIPKDMEHFQQISVAGSKKQWLTEAIEAATGNKTEFIKQLIPDYKPPFPEVDEGAADIQTAPSESAATPPSEILGTAPAGSVSGLAGEQPSSAIPPVAPPEGAGRTEATAPEGTQPEGSLPEAGGESGGTEVKPNKHGVYDKKDAEALEYKAKKAAASIHVLKVGKGWISAPSFSHNQGNHQSMGSPLSLSGKVYPTREEAINDAAKILISQQQSVLRSDATANQKQEAENIARWAARHLTPEELKKANERWRAAEKERQKKLTWQESAAETHARNHKIREFNRELARIGASVKIGDKVNFYDRGGNDVVGVLKGFEETEEGKYPIVLGPGPAGKEHEQREHILQGFESMRPYGTQPLDFDTFSPPEQEAPPATTTTTPKTAENEPREEIAEPPKPATANLEALQRQVDQLEKAMQRDRPHSEIWKQRAAKVAQLRIRIARLQGGTVLKPGNVNTSADVETAKKDQPLGAGGEFSVKVAKEQKKFLLDAIDQAIEQAPDTDLKITDPELKADLARASKTESEPPGLRNLPYEEWTKAKADFRAREAEAIQDLFEKYGIPTHQTPSEPFRDISGEMQQTVTGHEFPLEHRVQLLKDAINDRHFASLPKVTIEVPGDGTFEVINTKAALAEFKERAGRFPTTTPRMPKPTTPRATPTPAAPLGKPDKESALKAAALAASNDPSRKVINNLWSDGQNTVGTNGRMLTRVSIGIGGTEENPVVVTPEGKPVKLQEGERFPAWRQVVPKEHTGGVVKNLDTEKLFNVLRQAQEATTEKSNSVKLFHNNDATLGVSAGGDEAGVSYEHNVQADRPVIAAFNPEYLMAAINAARRVGDKTVNLEYTDELSPITIRSEHTESVVMPMRLSAGAPRAFGGGTRTGEADLFGGGKPLKKQPPTPATTPAQLQAIQTAHTPGLGSNIRQIVNGLLQPFLPSAKSQAHLTEAERLGSVLGPMHRREEAAATQLRPASRYFDRLGVHDERLAPDANPGIKFMSDMSQGRPMPAKEQAIADQVQKLFEERLDALRKAGAPLQSVRDNYFPGMWTRESRLAFNAAMDEAVQKGIIPKNFDVNQATPAQKAAVKARVDQLLAEGKGSDVDMLSYFTKRPFKGKESFRKEKVFDDIMDAAEFGLRPISNNPIDLVKGKLAEMGKSIMANEEFQLLEEAKKLDKITPYEKVPEGWVKVNDKYGTIYGPPTVKIPEYVDKAVYEGLVDFARSLGIRHQRSMTFPKGQGSRALGLSYTGQNFIRSRFGTETSVIAHEIGHQLDERYDLWNRVVNMATGFGKSGKPTKAASQKLRGQIQRELRAIADLLHGSRGQYVYTKPEKLAQMVEAYVHAPERMKEVAPNVFRQFSDLVTSRPELEKLATIKPNIELTKLTGEKYVGLPILGYRIVPKEVGDILNNYLSSSLYNNAFFGPLYKGWMAAANTLNQSQLGMGSAFHAGFTTGEAQVSAGASVIKDVYGVLRGNRSLKDLAVSAAKWPVASVRTAVVGDRVLNAWRNPDGVMSPKIAQIVKAAELAGGGFKVEHGVTTEQSQKAFRDWFSGHRVRASARTPIGFTEMLSKPIMDYLVPRQKAGVFAELASRIIERNPGRALEDLTPEFRQAWNRVDARLGQVRYDRLFANNTAKNVVQALVRAPGWTGGTIAELGGAFPDAAKFMREWVTTGKLPAEIPDRVAYTLSLLATVGAANGLLTWALSGERPQSAMDYIAFWDGTYDKFGNKKRWLLPTYMKDLLAYAIHPSTTLQNKSHPALSVLNDVLNKNQDYYGYEIRDPHAPALRQAGQAGKYVLKSFEPFWIRGAQQASQQAGGLKAKVAPYFGVMPAPRYVTMTPIQREISDLYHQRTGEALKPYSKQFTPQKQHDPRLMDLYQFKHLPQSDRDALRKRMTPEERRRYG